MLSVKYESKLELRRSKYLEIFQNYVKEKCDSKHRQSSNLSPSQSNGIKKLKKRISEGELIVCLTDKSGRLAVMPTELYHSCGNVHTEKDEEVDDETVELTQKLLNGHVSMWMKMTNMGESHQHQQRQRATHIEQSATVPPLYLLVKDHKKT